MKILIHHRTQGRGVEGVHLAGMVSAFTRAGHTVTLVSPPGVTMTEQGPNHPNRWKWIRYLPELFFELLELVYNGVSLKRLKKEMPVPDMIYERYAFLHFAGARMAQSARIPFFLEVNFTSHTPLYRTRSFLIKPLDRVLERYIFKRAAGFFVVSTTLKKDLLSRGTPSDRIVVLPNAVDETIFDLVPDVRERLGLGDRPVIGFVGGFYPWHGVHRLMEILPQIREEVPDVILLLVGDGPLKKEIEAESDRMGGSVIFTGNIPHAQLPSYIAAFDIAVMPDSNDYGSPMKIYEYMAMGKPVVAPKLLPIEEGVQDGETGILFPRHDQKRFAEAILALLTDPSKRLRMGMAARTHILKNHTWTKNMEKVIQLYEGLLAKKDRP